MYDALIFWVPIVAGGVFVTAAFSALYAGATIHAIWYGFAAVVGFALVAALQLDHSFRVIEQTAVPKTEETKSVFTRSFARSSDERPLLVFESVAVNAAQWRLGTESFKWDFRFHNYGKHAAKIISIKAFTTISDSVPAVDGTPRGNTAYSPQPFVRSFDVGDLPVVAPSAQTQEFSVVGDRSALRRGAQVPDDVKGNAEHFYLFTVKPDRGPPTIDSDGIHFWLVGAIEYKDIFEDGLHTTQFGVYLTNPFHRLAEYPSSEYNYQN